MATAWHFCNFLGSGRTLRTCLFSRLAQAISRVAPSPHAQSRRDPFHAHRRFLSNSSGYGHFAGFSLCQLRQIFFLPSQSPQFLDHDPLRSHFVSLPALLTSMALATSHFNPFQQSLKKIFCSKSPSFPQPLHRLRRQALLSQRLHPSSKAAPGHPVILAAPMLGQHSIGPHPPHAPPRRL